MRFERFYNAQAPLVFQAMAAAARPHKQVNVDELSMTVTFATSMWSGFNSGVRITANARPHEGGTLVSINAEARTGMMARDNFVQPLTDKYCEDVTTELRRSMPGPKPIWRD